jgi:hypothetical protein
MPAQRYRHAVVCLTGYTDFAQRITRPDVELYALTSRRAWALGTHLKLFKLLRRLRPAILHTYNLAPSSTTGRAAGRRAGAGPRRARPRRRRPARLNRKHNLLRRC